MKHVLAILAAVMAAFLVGCGGGQGPLRGAARAGSSPVAAGASAELSTAQAYLRQRGQGAGLSPGQSLRVILAEGAGNGESAARARAWLTNRAAELTDEIAAALADGDDDARVTAAWALRHAASNRPNAYAPLVRALRDPNFGVARMATVSLKEAGGPVDQALREQMADADTPMRWRAVMNADYINLRALDAELAALAARDPSPMVRADAVNALRGAKSPEALAAVARAVGDEHARTRNLAEADKISVTTKEFADQVERSVQLLNVFKSGLHGKYLKAYLAENFYKLGPGATSGDASDGFGKRNP